MKNLKRNVMESKVEYAVYNQQDEIVVLGNIVECARFMNKPMREIKRYCSDTHIELFNAELAPYVAVEIDMVAVERESAL